MPILFVGGSFLKRNTGPADVTIGSAEVVFLLGFRDNLSDDVPFGFYTGNAPRLLLWNPGYRSGFRSWQPKEPGVYWHVQRLIGNESRQVCDYASYVPQAVISFGARVARLLGI